MRTFTDPSLLSINTTTVRKQGTLLEIFEACARYGIGGVCPWRDQVADTGLSHAAKAVRDLGFKLSGYCRGGMLTSDEDHKQDALDDNRRAVDEAATLGAPCLVLVVGGLPQFSRPGSAGSKNIGAARDMVADRLGDLLDYAKSVGMPLAIEPLHPMYAADRACVNTMAHALDICDALDPGRTGAIGVAVDVYHTWWDPALQSQIARAGKDRLMAFHVCDWLVPTTDLLNDRGMMGDGVIDIRQIRGWVEAERLRWFQRGRDLLEPLVEPANGRGARNLRRAALQRRLGHRNPPALCRQYRDAGRAR